MTSEVRIILTAVDKASGVLKGTTTNVKGMLTAIGAVSGVAIAAGAAIKKVADDTALYNKQIRELTQVTGGGAEEISRIVQVADDWGISIDQVRSALVLMNKNGMKPSIENLAQLADEYVNTADKTQFAEKANKLFGRQYATLIPLFAKGGDAFKEWAAAVDDSLIATDKSIANARAYEVALDALNDQVLALKLSIGNKLIPELVNLLPITKEIVDWASLETKTQKGVERQYAMVAGQLRDVTEIYKTLTPEQLAVLTATEQLTDAVEEQEQVLYSYRYVVTDVDHEASRAAQAVTNFAIGVDKTGEAASSAEPEVKGFLDGIDRNIASPIASFIKDIQWMMAGGGEITKAFETLQELAPQMDPAEVQRLAGELLVATTDLEVTLDPTKLQDAAANLKDTLGAEAARIAMQEIRGTEGIEGALQAVTDVQYYLDFHFRYHGTPPSAYTGGGSVEHQGNVVIGGPHAAGGPVMAGVAYPVGEKGPEMFVPNQSGTIIPNDKMGGTNINIAIYPTPGMNEEDVGNIVAQKLSIMYRNMRAGGYARGA